MKTNRYDSLERIELIREIKKNIWDGGPPEIYGSETHWFLQKQFVHLATFSEEEFHALLYEVVCGEKNYATYYTLKLIFKFIRYNRIYNPNGEAEAWSKPYFSAFSEFFFNYAILGHHTTIPFEEWEEVPERFMSVLENNLAKGLFPQKGAADRIELSEMIMKQSDKLIAKGYWELTEGMY